MTYADTLAEFAQLQEDWDSYGAATINPETIETMRIFLEAIQNNRAQLVPTHSGGCQIEVHEQGFSIEIEFYDKPDNDVHGDVWIGHD